MVRTQSRPPRPSRLKLARMRSLLGELRSTAQLAPRLTATSTRLRWGSHVPALVRRLCRMLQADPELFHWLGTSAALLEEREEDVQDLLELRAEIEALLSDLSATLTERRSSLFVDVHHMVARVRAAIDSPLTPPERAARMAELFQPVQALLRERRDELSNLRQRRKKTRSEEKERIRSLQDELERKTVENQILRGEMPRDLPVRSPAPAPKRRRRTSRT